MGAAVATLVAATVPQTSQAAVVMPTTSQESRSIAVPELPPITQSSAKTVGYGHASHASHASHVSHASHYSSSW